jgi:hypothetical protein
MALKGRVDEPLVVVFWQRMRRVCAGRAGLRCVRCVRALRTAGIHVGRVWARGVNGGACGEGRGMNLRCRKQTVARLVGPV